jgi:hypothetical protein
MKLWLFCRLHGFTECQKTLGAGCASVEVSHVHEVSLESRGCADIREQPGYTRVYPSTVLCLRVQCYARVWLLMTRTCLSVFAGQACLGEGGNCAGACLTGQARDKATCNFGGGIGGPVGCEVRVCDCCPGLECGIFQACRAPTTRTPVGVLHVLTAVSRQIINLLDPES